MSTPFFLADYDERDLVRVVDGFGLPAGRLPWDATELPPGCVLYDNRRCNKYWGIYEGRIVLLVKDHPNDT